MYYNGHRLQAYQVTRSEQMTPEFSPLTRSAATFDYHPLRMKVCHNILSLIVSTCIRAWILVLAVINY